MTYTAQPGDILLYSKNPGFIEKMIQIGESINDGVPIDDEFFHVAIALDSKTKIEAMGGKDLGTAPIDYGNFVAFRPPLDMVTIKGGLAAVESLKGQKYDWILILDDAIRDLTNDFIHLPKRWVLSEERKKKICSTVVDVYFRQTGFYLFSSKPQPEDIYFVVEDYLVK